MRVGQNRLNIAAGLAKQGEDGFPIRAPYLGETKGFYTWKNTRAVKAGLVFRPYGQTVGDTLRWYRAQGEGGRPEFAGPSTAKEAELLAASKGTKPVVRPWTAISGRIGVADFGPSTPHTARMAHDQALGKVMQHLLKDDTQVYKQFVENDSFRRFVGDMVYTLTNQGL
jgi:hypothetical protein